MEKIKLIIFDYDDTIIKRNPEEIFAGLGKEKEIIDFIMKKYPRIADLKKILIDVFTSFNISFNDDKIKEYCQKYTDYYTKGKIDENIKNLLERLSKNYILVILTNGGRELKIIELEQNKILNLFKEIITPEDSGFAKPDPMAFKYILDKFKVTPEETLSIGDSFTFDIAPAKLLGIKTIRIRRGGEAGLVLGDLGELNEAIISKL